MPSLGYASLRASLAGSLRALRLNRACLQVSEGSIGSIARAGSRSSTVFQRPLR